jgi:hypothetical protein
VNADEQHARVVECERRAGFLLRRAELIESWPDDAFLNGYTAGLGPECERVVLALHDFPPRDRAEAVDVLRLAARALARRANVEARVGPPLWSGPGQLEGLRRRGDPERLRAGLWGLVEALDRLVTGIGAGPSEEAVTQAWGIRAIVVELIRALPAPSGPVTLAKDPDVELRAGEPVVLDELGRATSDAARARAELQERAEGSPDESGPGDHAEAAS